MSGDHGQIILLTQARPGMVIARAVVDMSGTMLCNDGAVITPDTILRLALRGIKRLVVREAHLAGPRQEDAHTRSQMLELRFSRVHDNALMMDLHDTVAKELERLS